MSSQKSYFHKRIQGISYALQGMVLFAKEEPHARIHISCALIVLLMGIYWGLSSTEWLFICLAVGMVFTVELINTSLENLSDFIHHEQHPIIKKVKDLAAGAVLCTALMAVVIGLIIFLPRLLPL